MVGTQGLGHADGAKGAAKKARMCTAPRLARKIREALAGAGQAVEIV
jgi:hypothetical protein